MEGLLSFLLFAGVFFVMMRFGCGAHMMHGHHGGHNENMQNGNVKKHTDPVCGIEVDVESGYGKMHEGDLYRFCSRDCLDKFEVSPGQYLKKLAHHHEGGSL